MIISPQGEFVAAGLCKYIPELEKVTKDPISHAGHQRDLDLTEAPSGTPLKLSWIGGGWTRSWTRRSRTYWSQGTPRCS